MKAAVRAPSFDEMYAEILALPEGTTGEILGPGWMRTRGRPGGRHSRLARRLLRALGEIHVDQKGEWWIDLEREIRLPSGELYVPDLVGWHVGAGDLAFVDDNPITVTPDWACEILSRSNQRADRAIKIPTYAAAGVGHVWIVDLEATTVEVYEPRGDVPALVASVRAGSPAALPPFGRPVDLEALVALRPGEG